MTHSPRVMRFRYKSANGSWCSWDSATQTKLGQLTMNVRNLPQYIMLIFRVVRIYSFKKILKLLVFTTNIYRSGPLPTVFCAYKATSRRSHEVLFVREEQDSSVPSLQRLRLADLKLSCTANILLVKKANFCCLLFPVYFQCIFSTQEMLVVNGCIKCNETLL